jgi:hypothetical protein
MNTPNVSTTNWNLGWAQRIYADDGIHLFRDSAGPVNIWSSPTAAPNWSYTDKLVSFVQSVPGGQLLPIMTWSNPWQHPHCGATSQAYQCGVEAGYYQDWANEVLAVVDHLVSKGLAVPEIEVWNEPYCCNFWKPASDPAGYLGLVKATAQTVWAKYPKMRILVSANYWQEGSTCQKDSIGNCLQWWSNVLRADPAGFLNDPRIILDLHDYVEAASPTSVRSTGWSFDRYSLIHQQAQAHGKADPHVEITEYGWEPSTGCVLFNDGVSETTQAQYTVDGAKQAFATGYVDKVFPFFDYGGADTGCTGTQWAYNFHRADGTPRPVAAAIRAYIG